MPSRNWRLDERWRLYGFEPRLFREPPGDRPHVDAEPSADGHWATLYWPAPDGRTIVAAASWLLVGPSKRERDDLAKRARRRTGASDVND